MNLSKVKEIYANMVRLIPDGSSVAFLNQIRQLGDAIVELDSKPLTYLNTNMFSMPHNWRQWHDSTGYADKPYIRNDGILLFQPTNGGMYYAKYHTGAYICDSSGRKKFWKYPLTGMIYINRDIPTGETNARPSR